MLVLLDRSYYCFAYDDVHTCEASRFCLAIVAPKAHNRRCARALSRWHRHRAATWRARNGLGPGRGHGFGSACASCAAWCFCASEISSAVQWGQSGSGRCCRRPQWRHTYLLRTSKNELIPNSLLVVMCDCDFEWALANAPSMARSLAPMSFSTLWSVFMDLRNTSAVSSDKALSSACEISLGYEYQ